MRSRDMRDPPPPPPPPQQQSQPQSQPQPQPPDMRSRTRHADDRERERDAHEREGRERALQEAHLGPHRNHAGSLPIHQPVASKVSTTIHGPGGLLAGIGPGPNPVVNHSTVLPTSNAAPTMFGGPLPAAEAAMARTIQPSFPTQPAPTLSFGGGGNGGPGGNQGVHPLSSGVAGLPQGQQPILNVSQVSFDWSKLLNVPPLPSSLSTLAHPGIVRPLPWQTVQPVDLLPVGSLSWRVSSPSPLDHRPSAIFSCLHPLSHSRPPFSYRPSFSWSSSSLIRFESPFVTHCDGDLPITKHFSCSGCSKLPGSGQGSVRGSAGCVQSISRYHEGFQESSVSFALQSSPSAEGGVRGVVW